MKLDNLLRMTTHIFVPMAAGYSTLAGSQRKAVAGHRSLNRLQLDFHV